MLGGKANIVEAEAIAETRLRVIVADSSLVNRPALIETGVKASTEVSPGVWHLIVGLDADHYATVLSRKLASIDA
nr:PTS transporter subunit EIIB [Propionibacterium sp. oral taxon 192]